MGTQMMTWSLMCAFTVCAMLLMGCSNSQNVPEKGTTVTEGAARTWNFDRDPVGKTPQGWSIRETHPTKTPAAWQVTADPKSPSKPNVFSLIDTKNENGTYNLAVAEDTSYQDVTLSVMMRANTGKEDQGGGPIWRCKDENNYYVCRLNPLESNFRLYKVENGKRSQFDSAKVDAAAGQWHKIQVAMAGDQITCWLDGKELLHAKDETFKNAGMIGLWTKADAASSFDDLMAK